MMSRYLLLKILAFLLVMPSAHAEKTVEFTPAGSSSLKIGSSSSYSTYYKGSGQTLNSRLFKNGSNKRVIHLTAWFEKGESGRLFYIRPNNSWLMSNCPKLLEQIDVQIRGYRTNGKEAAYHATDATVSCHDLTVSGYDFDQYVLVALTDVDELFNYFWDYSAVEVDFSLGRLENEDLEFQLIFHAKDFRKNYKDLR